MKELKKDKETADKTVYSSCALPSAFNLPGFHLSFGKICSNKPSHFLGLSFLSLHTVGLELENQLLVVLDIEGAPVIRAWNVVNTLSKLLSPAAEAFRYFVLERGESFLAEQFGAYLSLASRR